MTSKKKSNQRKSVVCPNCGMRNNSSTLINCMYCGHIFEQEESAKSVDNSEIKEAAMAGGMELNTKINLCDTCQNRPEFPECLPVDNDGVQYGDGIGNDNIIKCDSYQSAPEIVEK